MSGILKSKGVSVIYRSVLNQLCLIVLIGSGVCAQEISNDSDSTGDDRQLIVRRSKEVVAKTSAEILRLEDYLEKLKLRLKSTKRAKVNRNLRSSTTDSKGMTYPSKEIKAEEVAKAEAELGKIDTKLQLMKKGELWDYGVLETPLKIGGFGRLQLGRANVFQVIDSNHVILKSGYTSQTIPRTFDEFLVMAHFDTKGLTDGAGVDLPEVFEIFGTTTYSTAIGGSNTIFEIRPLDTKPIENLLEWAKTKKQ